MKDYLVVDIETIPHQGLPPDAMPQFDPDSVAVGNRKPDTAAAYIEQKRQSFEADMEKKMSTDPALCQVCCVVCGVVKDDKFEPHVFMDRDETGDDLNAIADTWKLIHEAYEFSRPLITYNGIGFDLPVLHFRAMEHLIDVDPGMYQSLTRRYNPTNHFDLMQLLCNWNIVNMKGLNYFLRRFNLGGKTEGMDGSQVYPAWLEKRYDDIAEYCVQDVAMTWKLFKRVRPWFVKKEKKV